MASLGGGRGLRGMVAWACLVGVPAVTTMPHPVTALLWNRESKKIRVNIIIIYLFLVIKQRMSG